MNIIKNHREKKVRREGRREEKEEGRFPLSSALQYELYETDAG